MEGHWKFLPGGWSSKSKVYNQNMKLNWNFLGGGRVQKKKKKNLPWGGGGESIDIFWNCTIHCTGKDGSCASCKPNTTNRHKQKLYLFLWNLSPVLTTLGAFLWENPKTDLWSQIIRIMLHKRNRWIHSGQGFVGSFDAAWSKWSEITSPFLDSPKETHSLCMLGLKL